MRSKYGKCRLLRSIDKNPYDVTDNRGESDVILCFYLSILEDDMFRIWSASRATNLIIQPWTNSWQNLKNLGLKCQRF